MTTNAPYTIERTYDAPVEKVWKALTDKEQMKQWYFDVSDFKPEVGFTFHFTAQCGEEEVYKHLCCVTKVVPNKKLAYTWQYEGYEGLSEVTFELFPEGKKTRLLLTHSGLETFPQNKPDFTRESFSEGWTDFIATRLPGFVETGSAVKSVEINAPAAKVWDVLVTPEHVKKWGSAFSEGTYAETDWQEGSRVLWKDGNGNIGANGVVTVHNKPSELTVAFFDDLDSKPGDPPGEYSESYTLKENNGKTTLTVKTGKMSKTYLNMQNPMFDKALQTMKELAEN